MNKSTFEELLGSVEEGGKILKGKKAPSRSSWAVVASLALAVKKSTMMLAFLYWHKGMNKAMAAPVATPVNSKSPTMV